MSKICPKCNTENPDNSWFCSICGTALANQPISSSGSYMETFQTQNKSQQPTYKSTRYPTVPKINLTKFNILQGYANLLKTLSVILLIIFIILGFAILFLLNNIGLGGSGWIITIIFIVTGLLTYFTLAVSSQMAEALTSLDINTRQSIEYQKIDHEILEKLLTQQENTN